MANNDCIPFYEPGKRVTVQPTSDVLGKTFVKISGTRAHPVGLSATADPTPNTLIQVAPATAGVWAFGVATYDGKAALAPNNGVAVIRGSGNIVPVTALGAITAGSAIDVGTGGKATVHTSGVIVGYAVADAVDGEDAQIALV